MGSVPPLDSITMSDQNTPVEIFTEATCEIEMLSSLLPNKRLFTRLTRSGPTTIRVGNHRFPLVQRLAVKVTSEALGFGGAEVIAIPARLSSSSRCSPRSGCPGQPLSLSRGAVVLCSLAHSFPY